MQIDVDGIIDPFRLGIQYLGKATRQANGTWRCLANVGGALCLVEVSIAEVPEPLVWEGDNC
jgi:hypothetical protein